jgi:hypothetical protein
VRDGKELDSVASQYIQWVLLQQPYMRVDVIVRINGRLIIFSRGNKDTESLDDSEQEV